MKECPDIKYLKQHQRIGLLIKQLQEAEKQFDSAKDTHRHIRETLRVIEDPYVGIDAMSISSLLDCKYFEKEKLYVFHARSHTVFINQCGAYNISKNLFTNTEEGSFSFDDKNYKTLVEFKNSHGLPVFSNDEN